MNSAMKFALGGAMLMLPAMFGCDERATERPIAHEEKVDVKSDGTVKKEQTTVSQRPDGTIVKEETETKREVK